MKQKKICILAAAVFICACPIEKAAADIYQYTDKNGTLHFTNVNGGDRSHKRVKKEPSHSNQSAAASGSSSASAPISSANIPSAYLDIIDNACSRHGVDPSLVHAIVKIESDFNPFALSRKGAMGLMQLMPQTALDLNVTNSFDPTQNIDGGVKYIKYLIDRYEGNLSLALAAYNSGETAVKKWGTIPPFKETQNYVRRILKLYNGSDSSVPANYVTRYTTIYMGYSDDGALIVTDNPSSYQIKKLKPRKKNL